MDFDSKKLNNHVLYNNYRAFFPNNIFSPNQIRNLENDSIFSVNNRELINTNSLKTFLIINHSNKNVFEKKLTQNTLVEPKSFKGGKISAKNINKNQKSQNNHSKYGHLKTCKLFFDKMNKLNKSNRNSANDVLNVKISKIKKNELNLNRSCPVINNNNIKNFNKNNETTQRINDSEKPKAIRDNAESASKIEEEKKLSNKQSNIYKIEYLKKIIRKHYFENFDNLKEYFNNMSGKGNYLNIDDIIFYLKEIIKVNVDKKVMRQILYINGIIKVDFNNFKFIFFPDLKQNKLVNLKLKNEKYNFAKNDNVNNHNNFAKNKSALILKDDNMPYINKKESPNLESTNKSNIERIYQNYEISQKLKIRGLNNKMKFLLMDINKDYIIKRFNERYKFSKKYFKLNQSKKIIANKNINIYKKYDESKRIKRELNINNDNIINEKIQNKENKPDKIDKEKLKLFILKIQNFDFNRIEEIEKNKTTNDNNIKKIKKLKIDDNYTSNKVNDGLNNSFLAHKNPSTNRYLRNEIKNIDFMKNDNETSSIIKVSSFSLNKTKDTTGINTTFLKRNKTMNQIKEGELKSNEVINQDEHKAFVFFKNEIENNCKEASPYDNTRYEKDSKINRNSDILNFL